MEIILNSIGKLRDTRVILDGITIIAGENNTGKSTVGKALYSFFNAYHNIDEQIRNARLSSVRRILNNLESHSLLPFEFLTIIRWKRSLKTYWN